MEGNLAAQARRTDEAIVKKLSPTPNVGHEYFYAVNMTDERLCETQEAAPIPSQERIPFVLSSIWIH